ncbi:peptidase S28 [Mycena sanguinolenta]|nr:peptidase S28 [Mycena sanguinolenta]
MLAVACVAYALAPLVLVAGARPPSGLLPLKQPPLAFAETRTGLTSDATQPTAYFFDQILDHSNPSLGTFQQRFWFYEGYYKEGGPIILFNAGEEDASLYTGYLLNETITGAMAYAVGGATIVLEHRYWGASAPFANYSTANMKYLTLENNVQDYANFAKNVELPFASGAKAVPPPQTPWILAGGSYPGALAAYVKHTFPDLFYASYGTSGPVQAINDYYGYFLPVVAGAPQNCSTDMKAVIAHWDSIMFNGTEEEQGELLSIFGLQNVTHAADAASALQSAPWSFQELSPAAGAGQDFFNFCDTLEVKDNVAAGAEGYGLDYALQQWGAWQIQTNIATCGKPFAGDECWGTFDANASIYTDIDLSNTYRPWMWTICTQLGFWQNGDDTEPSIVSRLIDVAYWERQCPLWFPAENGVSVPSLAPVNEINALFGGWDIREDRLLLVNGEFDPWRSGSVSSQLPNAPKPLSTAQQPILLIETGVHCWDMITDTALANPHTAVVFNQVIAQIVAWMKEWDEARGN